MAENHIQEIIIDTQDCAKIALGMYQEWQKAMTPPIFQYLPFEEWLNKIIVRETKKDS